ncbi:DNRLRE domain-containing protein [Streptomyces microflavus]|uniref:LamG-like jellyroll fold domain-containing protein n=1 Tax=Streptomyces microflavus TaxID=1919 RepID=UPI0022581114|nr:LamG-like jellyroll fold domain-containing protein [Streptomyces microflavus]MCX4654736.1 DNRLRE domain-containing protein [Streptomyces microflavus]WSA65428.1 DNRLRE domain-containing protein [Streptomyces microflavus]
MSADAAQAAAKQTGKPVEVTSLRGESSEVFATPEGNLEAREYLRPVRARVKGEWLPVETDLARSADGSVAPKVTTVGLAFSGGGDAPLVRMTKAGRELALSWPTKLPAPELDGPRATYRDVLPDVDLRMEAQEDGFTQLLVVNSAEAAANEKLSELRLKLAADGMDVQETSGGGLEAVDEGAGGAVFEAPRPMMWDSSTAAEKAGTAAGKTGGVSARSAPAARGAASSAAPEGGDEAAPTESGKLAPVGVTLPAGGKELVLTPDAEVLRGKGTTYPVFIDPQWYSPRAAAWTMASKYWASSPQWKFNGESTAGLGLCNWNYCQPNDTKRLMYRLPTSKFAGKSILSAEFVVRNTWSASCTAKGVELWRTKDISSSTTWNSQNASGFWIKQLASKSFAYGYTGCAAKDAEFDVKSAVQEAANGKWSTMTFGLQAASESDGLGWKRFSDKAFLRVQYNRPPSQLKMSQLSMQYGGVCKRPDSAPRVRTLGTININGVTDPDGDNIAIQVQAAWDAGDGKGSIVRWKPALTSYKKSGSAFTLSLPTSIPQNKTVSWHVRSYDSAQYSPWSSAGDPTACYFVYDKTVPAAPSIVSGQYPESQPEDPNDPWLDGVGQYGTFTLDTASSDVTRYWYGINSDPSSARQLTTSAGAPKSIPFLPSKPGLNFITAQAFDAAGNGSEIRTYQFRVKAGQPERATWQLDEESGATEAQGSTPPRTLALHGGATTGAAGTKGTALELDGTSGYASSDLSVVDTTLGFTVSAWVKLSKMPTSAAIIAAQPGNHSPSFELYYSAALDRWVFNQYETDTPGAKVIRAMAAQPGGVSANAWTHLTGSYDSGAKKLRLYVNRQLVGETALPNAWNARRGLQIGAGSYSGVTKAFFPGAVDEVQIFDKVITQGEVDKLYAKQAVGDPGRPAIAVFPLDEEAGSTEIRGHGDVLPAKYNGGVTAGVPGVAGKAAQFNGTNGYAKIGQTSGPHVNTSRSFTVSAWAKMDTAKPKAGAVITSQNGSFAPGFELYYSATYDRWAFSQYSADTADATPVRAMQPDGTTARAGEWAHLVGVHDTVAKTLTLYVNGAKAGSVTLADAFYADQSMLIGASASGQRIRSFFPGAIDDVRLFSRPVSSEEVQQMFRQRPVIKSRWNFEGTTAGTPVSTPDSSEEKNPLSLYGAAGLGMGWIENNALQLNGTDAYAATAKMPVDTGASFTMTAWAQAAALPDHDMAVLSAGGANRSALEVRYHPDPKDPEGLGSWQLTVADKDDAAAGVKQLGNTEFTDVRDWNHIAVVYDGFAKQASLYVNGVLQEVACGDADGDGNADESGCQDLIAWADDVLTFKATKSLQIGRAQGDSAGGYFAGSVDDVWTFQGALNESQVVELSGSWFDIPTEVPSGS